jgi:hypothetical protein
MASRSRSHSRSRRSRKQLRGGTPAPAPITGFVSPSVSVLTPFAGGGCSRRGGSVLNDIAIPAVFFAANSVVGARRKSTKKRSGKRVRFSRRRR